MGFKEDKKEFKDAITFSDYSKRFISDEAKRFTTEDAEDASARIDMSAAAAFSLSAEKHKEKSKRIGGFIKESKREERISSGKEKDQKDRFIHRSKDPEVRFSDTSKNAAFKSDVERIFSDDKGVDEIWGVRFKEDVPDRPIFTDQKSIAQSPKPDMTGKRFEIRQEKDVKSISIPEKQESVSFGKSSMKATDAATAKPVFVDSKKAETTSEAKVIVNGRVETRAENPQGKTQKQDFKSAKKEQSKENKKAAQKTAVAKMLRAKGMVGNDLSNDNSTGDAMRDGNRGMIRVFTETINPVNHMKGFAAKIFGSIAPHILITLFIMMSAMAVLSVMASAVSSVQLGGEVIGLDPNNRMMTNSSLSDDEIDKIVKDSGAKGKAKKTIKFALSRVGYPYSQDLRTSGTYYDCSSLAYYSWRSAGVDISFGGNYPPTAAAEASMLKNHGTQVSGSSLNVADMKPGDLIFYGGSDNGRYLGIYHVAIYIGDGKVVEAMNEKYGVVYGTLRTKNIVLVMRPKEG